METVSLAIGRFVRVLVDAAQAALWPPEPAEATVRRYSPAVLMGAPPLEGRALRRLDRAEQITAAGA